MAFPSAPKFGGSDNRERFEKYEDQLLGHGAFKAVYKAFDHEEGIEVAWNQVRVNNLNDQETGKLLGEIELLRSLKHPNIIDFHDAWTTPDNNYVIFITELMSSGTLRQYISRVKRVRRQVVRKFCRQILSGLEYLHTHSPVIIHRDLKCDNIFINGNHGEVKIGDLGLSTYLRTSHAASVIGTPEFMAPEMYEEAYDERVDVYSFGMCVLEMLTNEYPYYECENAIQVYKRVSSGHPPESLANVADETIRHFIELCLRPVASRPSAVDLLNSDFLCEVPGHADPRSVRQASTELLTATALEDRTATAMSLSPGRGGSLSPTSLDDAPGGPSGYIQRLDDGTLMMYITLMLDGQEHSVEFPYDESSDSPESVAQELVCEFNGDTDSAAVQSRDQFARCIKRVLQEDEPDRQSVCDPESNAFFSVSLHPPANRRPGMAPTPSSGTSAPNVPPITLDIDTPSDVLISPARSTYQTPNVSRGASPRRPRDPESVVRSKMERLEERIMNSLPL